MPFHPFVHQVEFLRRPGKKDEPVVEKGGRVKFIADYRGPKPTYNGTVVGV
jgi:hypothetical protein